MRLLLAQCAYKSMLHVGDHSPPQKLSTDVHFPDLGTEFKKARRMSGSIVGLISSSDSDESNNNVKF